MLDLWIRPDGSAILEPAGTRGMQEQRQLLDRGYTKARVVTSPDGPPTYEICGPYKDAFVRYARQQGCAVKLGRDIERQLIADHLNLLGAKATHPACAVNEALQVYGGVARASDYIELRASVARFFACKGTEPVDALVEKIVAAGTTAQQQMSRSRSKSKSARIRN
jgi:hypothetical protein